MMSNIYFFIDTMAPSFSHVFALYDFDEGDPGVETLSSIYTPSLPENVDDCATKKDGA